MIVELVLFKFPPGLSLAAERDAARATLARWQANPDLVAKHYIRQDGGIGGGVYIWPSREAARAAHDEAWCAGVEQRTGSRPTFQYFDLVMTLDNRAGSVTEYGTES